jgi:pilus assembly protein CpaE
VERTIRALVAVEGLDTFEVQRAMPDDPTFQLLGLTDGVDETVRTLQTRDVDVLVVACEGREDDRSLQIIDSANGTAPSVPIVVLSTASPNGFLRRAFEAGAADMGLYPQSKDQLRFMLSKAIARTTRTSDMNGHRGEGKLICVLGPKGGTGKTLTSTNLAVALALANQRVLIIDLDLQFGDVAIMLRLSPERNITGGLSMSGRLDEPGLRSIVSGHRTGLDALLAPPSPAEGEQISREFVVELLDVARPVYDFIVVDTPAVVTDQVLAALDMSDWYVPIVTPDLPALKSVRLTAEMFDLLDYPKDRRLLVFNRANTEVGLSTADVEDAVGMPFAVQVPSSRDVPLSVNQGEPLTMTDPLHPVSRAIRQLADRCAGIETPPARRRGLFGFGTGRRKDRR